MKYIINACYGGYAVPEAFRRLYHVERWDNDMRTNEDLIAWVEENPDNKFDCAHLEVVEIPDDATDWELEEYDGFESIIAVVDGQICHIN